ncbi:TonB-dependent receptor [Shewanella sp. OPT22]|nr:TonB-dependent receptor [Shewanella sp. OPT22]
MLNNNFLAKSVRFALIGGAATAALSTPVFAAEENNDEIEKIEVTGSRLQRINNVTTSPILSVSAEEIQSTGVTRVEDFLNDLPQVFAAQNSTVSNGSSGTATVDLRGVGSARTLVLINGRRVPAGTVGGSSVADLNAIPVNMIERVEVLTGGSSASYGADAIGGVVNFILKKDFEGFQFDYQYAFAQHSNDNKKLQGIVKDRGFDVSDGREVDGQTSDFSFLLGGNFADGKGNVTAYATYRNIKAITQDNRDYSNCALFGNETDGFVCGGSSTIPTGRFTDFAGGFDYTVQGNEFVDRDGLLYNYGPLNYFQRPDERKNFGVTGHYELNDHATLYTELMFMDDRTVAQIAPSGNFFSTSSLNCDNPLLSDQQFDALCTQNGKTREDDVAVFIGRRNVEGGPRQDDLRHTQYRGVFGVKGEINDNWSYDVFANFGTTAYIQTYRNELSNAHIARSLNVVTDPDSGEAVCKSALDGTDPNCVPWNLFETDGVTQEALDYLVKPLYARGDTESSQLSALVQGDLTDAGFMIPGTTTGMLFAAGVEYRQESMNFEPDQGFTSGDGAGQGGATTALSGKYNVIDVFVEFELPLLEEKAFAEELKFEGAYRYSDYSTGNQTDTYKLGLNWKINDDVRVRSSLQQAVRAPNIGELFGSQSLSLFNWANDPCAGANPSFTLAECQRTGVTAAQYGSIATSPAGQYNQFGGGNPELDPETSTTVSAGIVFTPTFLDGFSIALDYYDIDIEDAIGSIGAADIVERCAKGDDSLCDFVQRRADTGDLWVGSNDSSGRVISTLINTGSFSTSGVDFDANYKLETGAGDVRFNLIGTYLTSYEYEPYTGADVIECEGKWNRSTCGAPSPEFRSVFSAVWSTEFDMDLTARWRYNSATDELTSDGSEGDEFGATSYLDLSGNWQATESTNLYFGVNNVLDKEPQVIGNAPSGSGNGNTFPGVVDALGRYVYMGVTINY